MLGYKNGASLILYLFQKHRQTPFYQSRSIRSCCFRSIFINSCKVSEKTAKLYRLASPFTNIFAAEGFEEVNFPLNQIEAVGPDEFRGTDRQLAPKG